MDAHRVKAGKTVGDEKLRQAGRAQKPAAGEQNAVGAVKDALRGK